MTASPILGVLLHGVGASFAATCYAPQKRVRHWSWQTFWLAQAVFCWLLLPCIGAALTIPDLAAVIAEAPRDAMRNSFLLGVAYGLGGAAFNVAIRYIGFSLTYAIAVGLSSVIGTLAPPLLKGQLETILDKPGSGWLMAGVIVGTLGIAFCGVSGRFKEDDLRDRHSVKDDLRDRNAVTEFCLWKGLYLSLFAGVLSAVYGLALDAAQPIADVAARHGAGQWEGNIIYVFSNAGVFLTTLIFTLVLHVRQGTLGEFTRLPEGGSRATLAINWLLAATTGLFWYGQFFFYNLGHVRMGTFKFTSWAIHMILLVLISNLVGVIFREWQSVRRRTQVALASSLLVLVAAVILLTYGNYLGEPPLGK
jgi:L-rhamnose-H+ transport protein